MSYFKACGTASSPVTASGHACVALQSFCRQLGSFAAVLSWVQPWASILACTFEVSQSFVSACKSRA